MIGHSSGTDRSSQGPGTALSGHLWGRPAVPSSALTQNHSVLCPSGQLTDRVRAATELVSPMWGRQS